MLFFPLLAKPPLFENNFFFFLLNKKAKKIKEWKNFSGSNV